MTLQGQIAGNVRTNSKNKRIVLFFIKNELLLHLARSISPSQLLNNKIKTTKNDRSTR